MAINRLFVDTGAFVGAALPCDQYHRISREIWSQLEDSAAHVYSSDAVFQETMGLLHVRAGVEFATRWAEIQLQAKVINWLPIDVQVRRQSLTWIKKYADQGVAYVDATSFALMRRENIRYVFGFDRHFTAAGFRQISG
jgi:uncharacterized protein